MQVQYLSLGLCVFNFFYSSVLTFSGQFILPKNVSWTPENALDANIFLGQYVFFVENASSSIASAEDLKAVERTFGTVFMGLIHNLSFTCRVVVSYMTEAAIILSIVSLWGAVKVFYEQTVMNEEPPCAHEGTGENVNGTNGEQTIFNKLQTEYDDVKAFSEHLNRGFGAMLLFFLITWCAGYPGYLLQLFVPEEKWTTKFNVVYVLVEYLTLFFVSVVTYVIVREHIRII